MQPRMGDFVIFFVFFRIAGLEGFSYSVPPRGNLKSFDKKVSFPDELQGLLAVKESLANDSFLWDSNRQS